MSMKLKRTLNLLLSASVRACDGRCSRIRSGDELRLGCTRAAGNEGGEKRTMAADEGGRNARKKKKERKQRRAERSGDDGEEMIFFLLPFTKPKKEKGFFLPSSPPRNFTKRRSDFFSHSSHNARLYDGAFGAVSNYRAPFFPGDRKDTRMSERRAAATTGDDDRRFGPLFPFLSPLSPLVLFSPHSDLSPT